MIDILLMVVIGGMGTMWGAVIGAVLLVLSQYYLRDLMGVAAEATAGLPLLPAPASTPTAGCSGSGSSSSCWSISSPKASPAPSSRKDARP